MSWYLNLVCDTEDCKALQSFGFERENETFGEVIEAMKGVGWTFEDDRALCPACSGENSNDSKQEGVA